MKNKRRGIALGVVTLLILSAIPLFVDAGQTETVKVIIGFEGKPDPSIVHAHGGRIKYQYTIINAIAAEMPGQAINALKNNPKIEYVEIDQEVHVLGETLPWGVDRIDAELVWNGTEDGCDVTPGSNAGDGIKVAILDTGIDYDHPDLNNNVVGGESFVDYTTDYMDDNGHGTHCAGIVAAEDNDIGVIGVAPEADLYGVKVLDSEGRGYESDVVAGAEWAVDNGMQIISMSLGSDSGLPSLHAALDNAYAAGLLSVAATGNDGNPPGKGDNVDYPARYDTVIAVAATNQNDERAKWRGGTGSSTGPDVELAAPGDKIYSTLRDNTYGTKSGTSMACPHVAGTAALVMASPIDSAYDFNENGSWDNDEVRQKMDDTAQDLGDAGRDNLYGYGLVDAEAAASPPPDKHDVAITAINAPSSVLKGDTATINVTVENLGTYDETFTLYVNDTTDDMTIGSTSVTLAAGASSVESFTWDTTGANTGMHTIKAEAILTGDEYPENNAMTTTIEVKEPGPGVTVTGIDPNTMQAGTTIDVNIAGSGFAAEADVTFENGQGPAPTASHIVVVDSNTITATVTAKSGGPPRNRVWDARVTNPDGSSGVLVGGFTVTS